MNNDMLAAAIVWVAEEELKADGRRIRKAVVECTRKVAQKFNDEAPEKYAAQALRDGLTVEEAINALNHTAEEFGPTFY